MTQRELLDYLGLMSEMKIKTRHCFSTLEWRESVAEHSWRAALIPMLIESEFPDVNINKVIRMLLIHDIGEAVAGDIPAFEKNNSDRQKELMAVDMLIDRLPPDIGSGFRALFDEMNALETKEAKLYKVIDNLEAIISHNESPLSTWIPLEYELNLTYGEKAVSWNDWLVKLKAECNADTIKKIEAGE